MKINLETYELYVIDYLEGNLSDDMRAEFDVFLLMNPEIEEELIELNSVSLEAAESISFDKTKLQKDLFSKENIESNFEDLCVDYIENQLNGEEKLKFDKYLSLNVEKEKIFKSFQKTILSKEFIKQKGNFKTLLKQLILTEKEFNDEISIAYTEGDLTKNEKIYFEELVLTNSTLSKNINFYKNLKVRSKQDIIYTDKLSLRKKERKPIFLWNSIALAASIFLFGFFLLQKMQKQTEFLISENKPLQIEATHVKLDSKIGQTALIGQTDTLFSNFKRVAQIEKPIIEKDTIKIKNDEKQEFENEKIINEPAYIKRTINIKPLESPILASAEELVFHNKEVNANNKNLINLEADKILEIPQIKFWKVASFAVLVFNKATKAELVVNSEYDEEGNLLALDIVSENFNYSKQYNN